MKCLLVVVKKDYKFGHRQSIDPEKKVHGPGKALP
jgi:hypothetical protein